MRPILLRPIRIIATWSLRYLRTLLDSPVRTERLTSPIGAGHNDLSGFVGQNIRSKVMSGTGQMVLLFSHARSRSAVFARVFSSGKRQSSAPADERRSQC